MVNEKDEEADADERQHNASEDCHRGNEGAFVATADRAHHNQAICVDTKKYAENGMSGAVTHEVTQDA